MDRHSEMNSFLSEQALIIIGGPHSNMWLRYTQSEQEPQFRLISRARRIANDAAQALLSTWHLKPKAVLRLPDLDQAKSAVLKQLEPCRRPNAGHAIGEFVE